MKPAAECPVAGARARGGEGNRAGAGLKEAAEVSCPVEGMVKLLQVM